MFPSDDLELVAPQWLKCYSYSQGLVCRGDGKHCRRKVDVDTGDFANKETRQWEMADGLCGPADCPMVAQKQCRRVMSLLFILPDVPGLGVYQLDTSSFYSIVNINSQLAPDGFIRPFTNSRIAFIPLILSVAPQEVTPPGVGRKTVHVLSVRADVKLADIIRISRQGPAQVLLPTLSEEEPPDDLMPEEVLKEAEEGKEAKEAATETPGGGEPPATIGKPEGDEKVGEQVEPAPTVEGAGFKIDMDWLGQTLNAIKWSEDTAKTWLVGNFKVNPKGKLADILALLTREQAERFTRELNERAARVQPELF